jgi:hypothetical protein
VAKGKQEKGIAANAQRVLQDDYAQEQLRAAAGGLVAAYKRMRQERGDSVEDKKLYANLRQAATSARNAAQAFLAPEPEPSHRKRRLTVIALAIAGTTALTMRLQKLETQRRADIGSPSAI